MRRDRPVRAKEWVVTVMDSGRRKGALVAVVAAIAAMGTATAGAQNAAAPQQSFPVPGSNLGNGYIFQPAPLPAATPITANATVVEDVIARINDQVITRTEYERAEEGLVQEAKQENWTPAEYDEKQRDLLRDMIDQQLLLSKGKELGITGDAETMRELDDIRKRANLPDLDALRKAAEAQGVSYEDFKQNIQNQAITQEVVRDEVGRRIGENITPTAEQAYYEAHLKDFELPEQVHLSEILVTTPDNATDAQIAAARAKADQLEAKLKAGANFADLARTSSGGPTASAGGDLGDFKRGTLGDVLEKATFSLQAGQYTEPIRTRQGYVILRVDSHQMPGTAPLQQVENQVQEGIYMSQLQPALRKYLTQARQDAYLKIAPGFVDTGSSDNGSNVTFTSYTPPPLKKKVIRKQRAEEEKAAKAEQQLAEARAKLAAKQRANGGHLANVAVNGKRKKIHREKVRFGQAPRNALPAGAQVAAVPSLGAAPADVNKTLGEAPGAAIGSPTQSVTSITTGTGVENEDALEARTVPDHKTRFAQRQSQTNEKKAQLKLASAEVKASKRPVPATPEETADEKVQSAPLGLAGDTVKKKSRHKRKKGEPKQRLEEKPAAKPAPSTVAPTVNSTLGASATSATPAAGTQTSDHSVLPPATPTPPNPAAPAATVPATTSASPNSPTTSGQPPQ